MRGSKANRADGTAGDAGRPGRAQGIRPKMRMSPALRWLPSYIWQTLSRRVPRGPVHLVLAIADHFEPAIIPENGRARAPYDEQERRLEEWCQEYPRLMDRFRDHDGCPFSHTYFYPAEQYDSGLVQRLADHCREGWGEIEVHLHHGADGPDTAENTYRQLAEFRDVLASRHGCLSYLDESGQPRYAFVHGNFALANSNQGLQCGVDSEMQVLADTGCYADLTLPAAPFHPAQTSKINSLYECALPLSRQAPQRRGNDLRRGRDPRILPLIIQGPLMVDYARLGIENGSLTPRNPARLYRLGLWKQARIRVEGRPDWLFIKLHCHSMDPTQRAAVIGEPAQQFLRELVEGAGERGEILHFVTAREMANVILAACDGREGNPGDYRDYRLKRRKPVEPSLGDSASRLALRG
jgi:hypothetical protein